MIKNIKYVLLFLFCALVIIYLYNCDIFNLKKIENFQSINTKDKKHSKSTDFLNENMPSGSNTSKIVDNLSKQSGDNLNIPITKKSEKEMKPSKFVSKNSNSINKKQKENNEKDLTQIQNEIDDVIKELLLNRYKFYNKKIKITSSEFKKRKDILETKLKILQNLNKDEKDLNSIINKKKEILKYKPEKKQVALIDTQGEVIGNSSYTSEDSKDISELIQAYSKKKNIMKYFTFIDSLDNGKKSNINKNNKLIEGFTNPQKCSPVQFYSNDNKYCFISKNKKNCFNQKLDFGINKKLDSSFISILNYINQQKDPIMCINNKIIIEYLKKWGLFEGDNGGYYLERYKKMFILFIGSNSVSESNQEIFGLQIKIINKMINLRYENEKIEDQQEKPVEYTKNKNGEMMNKIQGFGNTILNKFGKHLKNVKFHQHKEGEYSLSYKHPENNYSEPKGPYNKLDNGVFNRVVSAPYYESRFDNEKKCEKPKKCPELPNMGEYIKKTEIPCWGCKL